MSRKSNLKKLERQAYYQRYPSYEMDANSCAGKSEQFVAAIQQAANKVRFDEPDFDLAAGNLAFLKMFKKLGYDAVRQKLGDVSDDTVVQILHLTAGEALFRKLDELDSTILDRFAPFSMAVVNPTSNTFSISVHELTPRATRLGHAFLHAVSPLSLTVDGRPYQIAFSRHALQRFRDRLYPRGSWRNYGALGDIYAMLGGSLVIRHAATQYDGSQEEPLLAMYFYSSPGQFHISPVPENVLGSIDREANDYFVLAGYAPCAQDGDLLVVKTLLSPGMRGTPEAQAMREQLDPLLRMDMDQALLNLFDYRVPVRYDVLHWLHTRGAVQVVARPRGRLGRSVVSWNF
jgi:hypothetical protein